MDNNLITQAEITGTLKRFEEIHGNHPNYAILKKRIDFLNGDLKHDTPFHTLYIRGTFEQFERVMSEGNEPEELGCECGNPLDGEELCTDCMTALREETTEQVPRKTKHSRKLLGERATRSRK